MIRPDEITYLVLDDIEKCLNQYYYEEIELLKNKNPIFIRAKKSHGDHLFEVGIEYNDVTRIVYTAVYCLGAVPKDKRGLCLKLINFIGYSEKEIKYHLCPVNHVIFCCTSHSILDCRCSIGQLIESQASCSIDNLSVTYDTIKSEDLKISNIHPTRFHNDFWKGIDYV